MNHLISLRAVRHSAILLLALFLVAGLTHGQTTKQAKHAKQPTTKQAKRAKQPTAKHVKPRIPAKSRPTAKKRSPKKPHAVAKRRTAVKTLSPALVDSFRTIIMTSCADGDPDPLEISMREEMTRWLSVRYRRAGISMAGVDCSGFIKTLFRGTLSIDLPHSAAQQSLMGLPVERQELRFGDLIFFRAKKRINHVGIYLGEGYFVHSSRTFGVRVDPLFASKYYTQRFARARRVASFSDLGATPEE